MDFLLMRIAIKAPSTSRSFHRATEEGKTRADRRPASHGSAEWGEEDYGYSPDGP